MAASSTKAISKIATSLLRASNSITKSVENIDKQIAVVLDLQSQLMVLAAPVSATASKAEKPAKASKAEKPSKEPKSGKTGKNKKAVSAS
jgi:hypothetical protein